VKTSTSKAIRHRKNNTLRLLPGGGALGRAHPYVCRVNAAPPRNTNHKPKTTPTPRNIKKKLSLSIFSPVLLSFYYKKRDIY
ncbi:hypothetical protein ACVGXF_00435, partial [Enterobacter hormaechei]